MKKILYLLFSSALILGACSNNNSSSDDSDNKSEKNSEKTTDNKTKEEKKSKENKSFKEDKKEKFSNESNKNLNSSTKEHNNEQNSQDNSSNKQIQSTQNIDITNIKDKNTLESVIYGNYSETDKIQAYNNVVANGVIPQGNVMEGPAYAAYESSLRIENGQEQSVYDRPKEQDAPVEDKNINSDPNDEINAAQTKDEYYDALRKKYNGGLSSGELQTKYAIEQGYYDSDDAEEVYQNIKDQEKEIEDGKWNKYRN